MCDERESTIYLSRAPSQRGMWLLFPLLFSPWFGLMNGYAAVAPTYCCFSGVCHAPVRRQRPHRRRPPSSALLPLPWRVCAALTGAAPS